MASESAGTPAPNTTHDPTRQRGFGLALTFLAGATGGWSMACGTDTAGGPCLAVPCGDVGGEIGGHGGNANGAVGGSTIASGGATMVGGAGGGGGPVEGSIVADFSLPDVNATSPTYQMAVSPRDYLMQVSAWYFAHAT